MTRWVSTVDTAQNINIFLVSFHSKITDTIIDVHLFAGITVLFLWTWLSVVTAGIIPRLGDDDSVCRTYILNDMQYIDCSDRGLTELPEMIDYDVSLIFNKELKRSHGYKIFENSHYLHLIFLS